MRYLNIDTLLFVISLMTMACFFIGHTMDKVLEDEGFGPYGNMALVWVGFVVGLYVTSYLGYNMRNYQLAATGGMVGAFVFLAALVLVRNVVRRLGH